MAYTHADLAALEKAIASSAKKVKFEDREVEYRDMDEMLAARRLIRQELGLTRKNVLGKKHTFSFKKAIG